MSSSNCCFLTCILVSQEAGQVVWYSHLFQNFLQFLVIHTVKGFGIVNKAEMDIFLELSCFFDDPADVGNLISDFSAFSKTSLNIRKFTVDVLLKPGLENFEHYFTSVWDEYNCAVVWVFFGIAFLWDWNETWPFPFLWPLLSFPNLMTYWVQHFHNISFRIWNSSTGIPSPPLALFIMMLSVSLFPLKLFAIQNNINLSWNTPSTQCQAKLVCEALPKNSMFLLKYNWYTLLFSFGLPWWLKWLRIWWQCGRPGFNPWVGLLWYWMVCLGN